MTFFEGTKKLSVVVNKLIFIDFWATWCGQCKIMGSDIWSKLGVKEFLNAYIPLKIGIDVFQKYLTNTRLTQRHIF